MNHFSNRAVHRSAFPLLVPSKLDKPSVNLVADDKRTIKAAWANSSNDKLQALKQYRRARGLRDKCAKNALLVTNVHIRCNFMLCTSSGSSSLMMNVKQVLLSPHQLNQLLSCMLVYLK
jgi:hypothetical protein